MCALITASLVPQLLYSKHCSAESLGMRSDQLDVLFYNILGLFCVDWSCMLVQVSLIQE